MHRGDLTDLGGRRGTFQTTDWDLIHEAKSQDPARKKAVLGTLAHRYWKPVYCYLRRKGHPDSDAKDLTQGFFLEMILGKGLIEKADPLRGRFRTFLLTALTRYAAQVRRASTARKRSPACGLVSLDAGEPVDLPDPHQVASPEQAFHWGWASVVVAEVLAEVERECRRSGKEVHWQVFQARVLQPIFANEPPAPLADLCSRFGVPSEIKASNMVVTVKREFQRCLRHHIRQVVGGEGDVDDEIRDLRQILGECGAGD